MRRRDFLKTVLLTTGVLASGKVYAGQMEHKETMKVNRLSNRETPSGLEQKHVPAIEGPGSVKSGDWFEVKVKVGFMNEHPSTPEHWITKIKLMVDGQDTAVTEYEMGGISSSDAVFKIRLKKSARLEAMEHCNLHGTWISDPLQINVI